MATLAAMDKHGSLSIAERDINFDFYSPCDQLSYKTLIGLQKQHQWSTSNAIPNSTNSTNRPTTQRFALHPYTLHLDALILHPTPDDLLSLSRALSLFLSEVDQSASSDQRSRGTILRHCFEH